MLSFFSGRRKGNDEWPSFAFELGQSVIAFVLMYIFCNIIQISASYTVSAEPLYPKGFGTTVIEKKEYISISYKLAVLLGGISVLIFQISDMDYGRHKHFFHRKIPCLQEWGGPSLPIWQFHTERLYCHLQ